MLIPTYKNVMVKLQSTALVSTIALMAAMPAAVAFPDVSVPDVSSPDISAPDVPSPELLVANEFSVYDFIVEVTEGPLAGQQYDGNFCYPKDAVDGEGTEVLSEADGFSVSMNFFGNVYTASNDTAYPNFPTLTLEDGEIKQLDFWIEEGDRQVWWDLPHWDVSLFPQEDTMACPMTAPEDSITESMEEAMPKSVDDVTNESLGF